MNLNDFYAAAQLYDKTEQKILSDKLIIDLASFVAGFGLKDVRMQIISKIPGGDSPVKFAFGILLIKMNPDPKQLQKRALLACEFGVNVLKLIEKETVNRIIIRPKLKTLVRLDPNFLDRYVEFIQGHLNIFGKHVKVVKK